MSAPDREVFIEILPWRHGRARAIHVYREPDDWWVGYYRGPNHHYVCPLPTVVIRWPRKRPSPPGGLR